MKINMANPSTGQQKTLTIDDEHKLHPIYERRMGMEVSVEQFGDEWKGYMFRISGGNDKQGFPMMQGVLKNQRVRLLFKEGMPCYASWRRSGMRKRKSVRGCIVGHDLAILNLVMVKEGDSPVEGLTDGSAERRLGPKRASKIRRMFDLQKGDDVRKFVIRRDIKKTAEGEDEAKVVGSKAPKIQRLITPVALQRKRSKKNSMLKKCALTRENNAAYKKKLHDHTVAMKEKRKAEVAKKKAGKKVAKK